MFVYLYTTSRVIMRMFACSQTTVNPGTKFSKGTHAHMHCMFMFGMRSLIAYSAQL